MRATDTPDRAIEWLAAIVMLGWGIILAMPGDSLAQPQFQAFRNYGVSETAWAWVFGVLGGARLAALYINGRWPRTPHIRMMGALFGAISWMQIAWIITDSTLVMQGVATTGIAVYLALALAEIFSVYRAAFDARYQRR
jgi:hypothetical protein